MTEAKTKPKKMGEATRRAHNRAVAVKLAKSGIYVLPVNSHKIPMIPSYQVADSSLTAEQTETIREAHLAKTGREPLHIGSTCDVATVRRIWDKAPDAVPAIASGPSGLAVIDADQKHDGPKRLASFVKEHDITMNGVSITQTGSGGLHLICKNDGTLSNVAGEMKAKLGCDIRGIGGQFLAPGAILEDGRKYKVMKGSADLCDAVILGTLPDMPREFKALIGAARSVETSGVAAERSNISATEQTIRQAILVNAMPDGNALLDPVFAMDVESLAQTYPCFQRVIDDAALGDINDFSAARMAILSVLKTAGATAIESAAILMSNEWEEFVGSYVGHKVVATTDGSKLIEGALRPSGSFNLRNIARDYEKAGKASRVSDGSAFGAVDEDKQETEVKIKPLAATWWGFDSHDGYVPTAWAVDGLIPERGVVILHGAGNVGKSFLALDLLDHTKRGAPWFGRHAAKGGGMYLCGEGQHGLSSRFKALYDERPINSRYESIAYRGDLPIFGDKPKVGAAIVKKMILAAAEESGEPIKVVVLDNLAQIEGGVDENATLTPILRALSDVANELELVFVVLHHDKKDGSGYRGSSTIRDACDAMLSVTEDGRGVRTVAIGKMRDAARTKDAITFKLKVREVGRNQFGQPVTSCVVVEAKADATAALGPVDDDKSQVHDDAAARAHVVAGIVHRLGAGEGVSLAVVRDVWNRERDGQYDHAQRALRALKRLQVLRAAEGAVERGSLRLAGDWAWPVGSEAEQPLVTDG